MTKLSVNVNKVALLRNTRELGIPSVVEAAQLCIDAGSDGITVHPRPDQRHIRPGDVDDLAAMLTVEFNIEGNPFAEEGDGYPGFLNIVRKVKPAQCTMVPDSPDQFTSDHGWDLSKDADRLVPVLAELKDLGVRSSLFMDADVEQIQRAGELGADRIELYTEPFAAAFAAGDAAEQIERFAAAADKAAECGLGINAGHDLNLDNLPTFVREVTGVLEVSIGHALIGDALRMGYDATVKAYLRALAC
jgi:pyridoxine 5-phosphate synthase